MKAIAATAAFLAAVAFPPAAFAAAGGESALAERLSSVDPAAMVEIVPLAMEAIELQKRADKRAAAHSAELARRGIAEVPACGMHRYTVDTGGLLDGISFDEWGEFYIDRRFVTDEEMKTVKRIEAWIRKWFPSKAGRKRVPVLPSGKSGVPVFRGFEDARYQMHDDLIVRLVREFNADKAGGCGGTAPQAAKIADITPALVKAHMIEESGGNGPASKAAWSADPLQVNVPGDWGDEKKLVGLSKPERRNEGTAEANVRAAIRYLARRSATSRGRGSACRAVQHPSGRRDSSTDGRRRCSATTAGATARRPTAGIPTSMRTR